MLMDVELGKYETTNGTLVEVVGFSPVGSLPVVYFKDTDREVLYNRDGTHPTMPPLNLVQPAELVTAHVYRAMEGDTFVTSASPANVARNNRYLGSIEIDIKNVTPPPVGPTRGASV